MKIKILKTINEQLPAGGIADVTNRFGQQLIKNGSAEMIVEEVKPVKAKATNKAPKLTAEEQQGLIAIAKPKAKPAPKAKKK